MGAIQSKQNSHSNHGEQESPMDHSSTRQRPFCPTFFCPPRQDSALDRPPRSKDNGRIDGFGSPIPDTPKAIRRKMFHEDLGDDHRNNTIKNTIIVENENNNSRTGLSDYKMSSKYFGLEKEDKETFLDEYETTGPPLRTINEQSRDRYAPIHDGSDAESELHSKYEIAEVLGVGSTSICHRCIERTTGESRACKIIDSTEIDTQYRTMMDQFHIEIETLRSLRHPHIIRLFDVYITDTKIYIVMELMTGGELFDYVVRKGTLTEEEASRIVRTVTSALVYMHSKNVIHRDLKPENLMLAHPPRSTHDVEVKIIDFGLSKILGDPGVASSFLGTRGYLAPEMIQRREYTESVDAWALGVIVFVLLCGCLPFDDDCQSIPDSPDLRNKFALRFPRWAGELSESAKDLLTHLLDIDSRRRYTAEQALDHPWVRGDTASKDSLLQSPGRIRASPGRPGKSSQATKEHVSQMVVNRALANAQLAKNSPKMHVRKTSI